MKFNWAAMPCLLIYVGALLSNDSRKRDRRMDDRQPESMDEWQAEGAEVVGRMQAEGSDEPLRDSPRELGHVGWHRTSEHG